MVTAASPPPTKEPTAETPPNEGWRHNGKTIPADHVCEIIRAAYSESEADLLVWLVEYGANQGLSNRALAGETGISPTTFSKLLSGTYPASISNLLDKVSHFRRTRQERVGLRRDLFIQTSIAQRIQKSCDMNHMLGSIGFVYGPSGSGKTETLQRYCAENPSAYLATMRPGLNRTAFFRDLSESIGSPLYSGLDRTIAHIHGALNDQNFLIFDEAHQLFVNCKAESTRYVLEAIRFIHDKTKCGILICGTSVLKEQIERGPHATLATQLINRTDEHKPLVIKPNVSKADITLVCKGFGLPKATGDTLELVLALALDHSLGKLIRRLRLASKLAAKRKQEITWGHFIDATAFVSHED